MTEEMRQELEKSIAGTIAYIDQKIQATNATLQSLIKTKKYLENVLVEIYYDTSIFLDFPE